ncbi:hypothetical protein L1049_018811 [Liquidambar formosana]|uniref:gibberellin 3beta-dioxygenase n=1 Tax=Liquidambar formosana TaxID=63359 RepID=A0AAP0WM90_LIQFO
MTTLSEAYRDHPIHLHHIIPLDFDSVQAVPDSHVWPQSDKYSPSSGVLLPSDEHFSIPIIDLMDPTAAARVRHACETWGAFQLTSHGVSSCLLEDVEHEARRLFSLPARQKMKALRLPSGATGYGLARISPFFNKFMWHEGFTIMGSSADHARELWPYEYKRFCDVMDNYQTKMKALAERLLLLILESLDISKEEMNYSSLVHASEKGACTALQLNNYPSCPNPNQAMGLAPHTDTSLFTILHQSDTMGLQIFQDGVGWVSVCPIANALVVNVGDLLHILSNARFHSVLHRAVVNQTQHRLSIAYFYGLPADSQVSPASKLVGSGQLPIYRSLMVKEYIKMKAEHLDKALSLIRI